MCPMSLNNELYYIPKVNNRFVWCQRGRASPCLILGVQCSLSLFLPSHLWVRGAWSNRGAMYPNRISTQANPSDSWGIFITQLKHELDGSLVAHLYKLPHFHQATIVNPNNNTSHAHKPAQMSGHRSTQLLMETSRSSWIYGCTNFPDVCVCITSAFHDKPEKYFTLIWYRKQVENRFLRHCKRLFYCDTSRGVVMVLNSYSVISEVLTVHLNLWSRECVQYG